MKQFLVLFSVLLVACGVSTGNESVANSTVDEKQPVVYENDYLVKEGDFAPDFLVKLTNGDDFVLSRHRGKVVMLQFTASWCGVCRREMPHIEERIWQRHKDNEDFVLIGIDRDEPKSVVEEYVNKVGITYPMALDDSAHVFSQYAVRNSGITRNVLVGRDGRIVKLTRLFNEDEFNSLVLAIDSLLASPSR